MKYIVDIKGEIEGDYEIIGKYEERPHGKWIYIQYDGNPKVGNWHCSECREIAPVNIVGYSEKTNFCPNCGADMRGDAE